MSRPDFRFLTGAALFAAIGLAAVLTVAAPKPPRKPESKPMSSDAKPAASELPKTDLPKTEAEWKKVLTPQQFEILRKKGTERAFTGEYWNSKKLGVYRCAGCGQTLFSSDHKFDSGTGWPSYWQPIDKDHVATKADNTYFMRRTEVHCSHCKGHLGHVFPDGPRPTGLRYCINSAALKFEEQGEAKP